MADKTKIQLKRTSVSGRVPSTGQLDVGELAINLVDSRLFTKDGTDTVVDVLGQSLNTSANVTFRDGSFSNGLFNNISSGNVTITADANVAGNLRAANIVGNTTFSSNVTIQGILTVANTVSLGNTAIPVATISSNLVLQSTARLTANGSPGTNNQILTSNGSTAFWVNAGATFASVDVPSGGLVDNLWFDQEQGVLRIRYDNDGTPVWVDVTPQSAMGPSQVRSTIEQYKPSDTYTPASDSVDVYTAVVTGGVTSTIAAPSGDPVDGQRLTVRVYLGAPYTSATLSWATGTTKSFNTQLVTIPTTLNVDEVVYAECMYSSISQRWDVVNAKRGNA